MDTDLTEIDPVVLTDRRVDPHALIMEGVDDSTEPLFKVGDMSMIFFNRSPHWVRWAEDFWLNDPDTNVGNRRKIKNKVYDASEVDGGARVYALSEVELIAHSLAKQKKITIAQLRNTLGVVSAVAKVWGYR